VEEELEELSELEEELSEEVFPFVELELSLELLSLDV
jgi:hypothetical protein